MTALKVRRIGNSLGVVIPKDVLAELNAKEGDALHMVRSEDGYRLRKSDPGFEEQMRVAREVMRQRHAVLRELAK